jgi:transcriptional regulator with XRE-family HTH domain
MSQEVSGEHIKALRLAAGLDVAVLARRVSLSSAQLLQIENDQHSLFYSSAIRRHAAHKVWAHLSVHCGVQAQPDTPMAPAQPDPPVLAMPPSAVVLADPRAPILDLPKQDLSDLSRSTLAHPLPQA